MIWYQKLRKLCCMYQKIVYIPEGCIVGPIRLDCQYQNNLLPEDCILGTRGMFCKYQNCHKISLFYMWLTNIPSMVADCSMLSQLSSTYPGPPHTWPGQPCSSAGVFNLTMYGGQYRIV